jgi:hypothetical protein
MKKNTKLKSFLYVLILISSYISNAQKKQKETDIIRCHSTEYEEMLQKNDPQRLNKEQFEAWLSPIVARYKNSKSESGGIISIPVVVHVIHNGETVGTAPNITDSQVQSQITVMNNDFRKILGTPGYNSNPIGADIQVQFVLAKVDPSGNPTNGINRVNLGRSDWNGGTSNATLALVNANVKPTTIWDSTQYLNMWSVNFGSVGLLGYAQFPSNSTLSGLNANGGSANTDGVVANFATFGSSDYNDGSFLLSAPYDKGRTMTHEVGHWLGLRHIWGDAPCGDDFCSDTPTAHESNEGCPTVLDCNSAGNEMVENYMDYTDDQCMNIFTVDQKARIITVMNNALRRVSLKTSIKDLPIPLFSNDAEVKLERTFPNAGNCSSTPVQKVTIYNRGTSTLTSVVLNYSINGGSNLSYTWNGSLTQDKFSTFDMPVNSTVNGTIIVSISTVNGGADQRSTNNSASGTFTLPINFAFNTVVFSLQNDNWGSEISWNLKNSGGTIVYSGGPYTDTSSLPAIITENWTLLSNQCYKLTINDSYGDGICCSSGNGFYNVKNGSTTIVQGSSSFGFGNREERIFSLNNLGNEEFEFIGAVDLYPNPTKDLLNISIAKEIGLPDTFEIYNSVGQVIQKKSVVNESDLSVNTVKFANGLYFIKIDKDNRTKTLRFIKN